MPKQHLPILKICSCPCQAGPKRLGEIAAAPPLNIDDIICIVDEADPAQLQAEGIHYCPQVKLIAGLAGDIQLIDTGQGKLLCDGRRILVGVDGMVQADAAELLIGRLLVRPGQLPLVSSDFLPVLNTVTNLLQILVFHIHLLLSVPFGIDLS